MVSPGLRHREIMQKYRFKHLKALFSHSMQFCDPKIKQKTHIPIYEGHFYVRRIGLYLYKYRIYGAISVYIFSLCLSTDTRDVFYIRREVDLRKTAKVNAYIMHTFEKIELLSIHAT